MTLEVVFITLSAAAISFNVTDTIKLHPPTPPPPALALTPTATMLGLAPGVISGSNLLIL